MLELCPQLTNEHPHKHEVIPHVPRLELVTSKRGQ